MSEFDYKQRPFARPITQAEWDTIFPSSSRATVTEAHHPTTHSPEVQAAKSASQYAASCVDSGRPAHIPVLSAEVMHAELVCEVKATRYGAEFTTHTEHAAQEAVLQALCGCGKHMVQRGAGTTSFCSDPLCHGVKVAAR